MNSHQKVLIIDNSELVHRLIAAKVSDLGVKLLNAHDGRSGLSLAQHQHPDLILLDVNMPDLSGFEVCRLLKHDANTHDIPVIFLSGLNESVNKVKGFDLGAIDYVTKPFDPAELRARVRAALNTKVLMDLLTTQAQLDGLTGLHNRRYFDRRLEQEMDAARRYKRLVGLLLVDVDRFKAINDNFGHPKGDQVLRKVAALIRCACRQSDVPCRFGGDEFALILLESSQQHTQRCGTRLVETIRNSDQLKAIIDEPVTLSIGAAASEPSHELTAAQLVARADEALYASKTAGRDRFTLSATAAGAAPPSDEQQSEESAA